MRNVTIRALSLLLAVVLCAAVMTMVFSTGAAGVVNSGYCGINGGTNLTWTLDSDGTLTISGSGAMGSYSYSDGGPWPSETVCRVVILDGVTSIGGYAFYNCSSLWSIEIPDSVTSIGDRAFFGCDNLTSVTIPDSVTSIGDSAFKFCFSLTSVTIPASVTSIGRYAFTGCSKLSVIIPADMTDINAEIADSIGYGPRSISVAAENPCYTSLDGVLFDKDMTQLIRFPSGKEDSEYAIPKGVTSIGCGAFYSCDNLTSVTIPDGVTSIGRDAFYSCDNLTSVTIPDSVTSIGDSAFKYCSSLTTITIPNSVTSFGMAFYSCTGLTSIVIPDSVTSIENNAFRGCSKLTSVVIPDSVTSIGESAFEGCSSLTSVTIPDSVTSLGNNAFSNCSSLVSVVAPQNVSVRRFPSDTHVLRFHEAKTATCTEDGNGFYYSCSHCGAYYTDEFCGTELPMYGWIIEAHHTLTAHPAVEATCDAEGNIAYWSCSVCGKYFSDPVCSAESQLDDNGWILAAGHILIHHGAQEPTCTEDGWYAYDTCSRCGYTTLSELPALGHVWEPWSCDEAGYHIRKCTVCGLSERDAHHFVNGICSICGYSKISISASCAGLFASVAHLPDVKTIVSAAYDASGCLLTSKFTSCRAQEAQQNLLPDLSEDDAVKTVTLFFLNGSSEPVCLSVTLDYQAETYQHDYRLSSFVAPSCTEAGKKTYTCRVCGDTYTDVIPATGHTWTEATCTIPKTCSACGAVSGSALGHDYVYGQCTRCGSFDGVHFDKQRVLLNLNGINELKLIGAVGTLRWFVSDPSVVGIDTSGDNGSYGIVGFKEGEALITATDERGKTAYCRVIVGGESANSFTLTIFEGESLDLSAYTAPYEISGISIHWESSVPSVAAVTSDGVLQGQSEGASFVTAQFSDGLKLRFVVFVEKAVPHHYDDFPDVPDFGAYFGLPIEETMEQSGTVNYFYDIDTLLIAQVNIIEMYDQYVIALEDAGFQYNAVKSSPALDVYCYQNPETGRTMFCLLDPYSFGVGIWSTKF